MRAVVFTGAYEHLGIEQLSACLKQAGHETFLVFDNRFFADGLLDQPQLAKLFNPSIAQLARKIADFKPDMALFSPYTDTVLRDLAVCRAIKKLSPAIVTVFGGMHATAVPERLMCDPAVDFVCVGEGEGALIDLMQHLEQDSPCTGTLQRAPTVDIPNLWYKQGRKIFSSSPRPHIQDLDSLPFPDKKLFFDHVPQFSRYWRTITGRGCPYNCSFCCHSTLEKIYGRCKPRRRSVSHVLEELSKAKLEFSTQAVIFEDDLFAYDKAWLAEFAGRYPQEVGLPYQCTAYPTLDGQTIELLRKSGCRFVEIGVQTWNGKVRREFLNRHETNEQISSTLRLLSDSGMHFNIFHITGIPGVKTESEIHSALKYTHFKPCFIHCVELTYYPGTAAAELAESCGAVCRKDLESIASGHVQSYERHSQKSEDAAKLMALVPLLPRPLLKWLVGSPVLRLLPGSSVLKIISALIQFLRSRASYSMRIFPLHYLRMLGLRGP
ncbi:MAG: cobalamin-dependent protein [Candidatus Wallbacteria bacterium]|nr:cobalamin-dependent protein [Candidatus Wallbacteria bacterium]